jgi:predicted RNA-binding protein with EMAP domain
MKAPGQEPKIATMQMSDLEKKLGDLNVLLEKKLERINEIEEKLDEQEYLTLDSKEWMSDEEIAKLVEEKDDLIKSKGPLELAYDKALAEKKDVLTKPSFLN